jgi:2-methylcitrate dehydratase PrpD
VASRRKAPVTITMKDGRKFTRTVEKVRGSPGNPMTRDELVGKYRSCASRALKGERLERSIAALENLDRLPAAKDLIDTLTV